MTSNTDKLLICAKAEGYEFDIWKISERRTRVDYFKDGKWLGEYDPYHNDAQAFELLRWLVSEKAKRYGMIHYPISAILDNEAIINAVVAMEDTHE